MAYKKEDYEFKKFLNEEKMKFGHGRSTPRDAGTMRARPLEQTAF